MSYDDRNGCCPDMSVTARQMVPLVDLMENTERVGLAIVSMAMQIEKNLFGGGDTETEKTPPVMCFEDALIQHRSTLEIASNTLARVCERLGVRG